MILFVNAFAAFIPVIQVYVQFCVCIMTFIFYYITLCLYCILHFQ
jgi:hypothetical protein